MGWLGNILVLAGVAGILYGVAGYDTRLAWIVGGMLVFIVGELIAWRHAKDDTRPPTS